MKLPWFNDKLKRENQELRLQVQVLEKRVESLMKSKYEDLDRFAEALGDKK